MIKLKMTDLGPQPEKPALPSGPPAKVPDETVFALTLLVTRLEDAIARLAQVQNRPPPAPTQATATKTPPTGFICIPERDEDGLITSIKIEPRAIGSTNGRAH